MRRCKRCLLFVAFQTCLSPGVARATVLRVTAEATVDLNLWRRATISRSEPCSTRRYGSMCPGGLEWILFPLVGPASGAFTWDDGVPRQFTVTSARAGFISAAGLVGIEFLGAGPTINLVEPIAFSVIFNIGENPHLATDPWDELFLDSNVDSLGACLQLGDRDLFAVLAEEDVSGSVAVSEPVTLVLLASGLALAARRRRRSPPIRSA